LRLDRRWEELCYGKNQISFSFFAIAAIVSAQKRVDGVHQVASSGLYHRVYAIVPLIGSSKKGDPLRPMFVPAPPTAATGLAGAQSPVTSPFQPPSAQPNLISYQMQISDDGKFALVEFVGATARDLAPIVNSTAAGVRVFVRGKDPEAAILAAFQEYKKTFQFTMFSVRPQPQ
jgi:hypothetical protein